MADKTTADLLGLLHDIPVRKGAILPLTQYGDNSARVDWTAGLPGSLWEALTAPARAYRGEIPENQMIPEGLNFAGSVALGSAAAPRGRVAAAARTEAAPRVSMPALPPENPVMAYLSPKHASYGLDSYNKLALEAPAVRAFNPHDPSIIGLEGMRSASQPTTPLTDNFMGHNRFAGRRELDFVPDTESMIPNIGDLANENVGRLSTYDRTALNQAWRRKVAHTGEFFSNPETSSAPGLGLMSAAKQEPKGFTAFHGSPHDFDKFDMSKIGTGEGAQAYGHGLYFADSEGVAKSYRNALSPTVMSTADGASINVGASPSRLGQSAVERVAAEIKDAGGYNAAVQSVRDIIANPGSGPSAGMRKTLAESRLKDLEAYAGMNPEVKSAGHMYQVRINADPDHFLDWDKPLSQQSEAVRAAIDRLGGIEPDATGEGIHGAMWARGHGKKSTGVLRDLGIPGIKYLDQGSRAAGDGSRNYVVFDDKLIEILKKYGLLGMLGGGALASQPSGPGILSDSLEGK